MRVKQVKMKKKIFLADLTHTGKGILSSTFPLGISFVGSYVKKIFGDDYGIKIFKFPEHLSDAIMDDPPQILCLSNYSWNLELGYKLSSLAKQKFPNLIVVFGGPNYPESLLERVQFLKQHPTIDFYIQNEGEVGFVELIKKLQEYNFDINKLKNNRELIINCSYLDGEELIVGPFQSITDPNIIPSPYLTGLLDEFFNMKLAPMLETTRGCPFSCSFCVGGLPSRSRIARFDHERTKKGLNYIVEHVKNVDEMLITDLNFGMYKEDIITAQYIADIQKEHNWPIVVHGSGGKNNRKGVIETARLLKGTWYIGASIQSTDKEILTNIKRNNISLDMYKDFINFNNSLSKDTTTFTEFILGLPGDTKAKHFESLRYGIDNGVNFVRSYQAILLTGTGIASQETRKKFGFITKFRVIPGAVGIYHFDNESVPIAEIEEIVVGSKDMKFEDYISCRLMDLFVETYINNALFEEVFIALREMGASVFDCLIYIHEHDELYTPKMKEIIAKFIEATKNDLYNSRKEAEEYILNLDIIKKHMSGELGINEILAYKTELYLELEDLASVLLKALKLYLSDNNLLNDNAEKYFGQLMEFISCKKRRFYNYDEEIQQSFNYNFKVIDELNYKINPRNIEQNNHKFCFKLFHTSNQKKHIKNSVDLYKNTPSGIGRMIQRTNLKRMYRHFELIKCMPCESTV